MATSATRVISAEGPLLAQILDATFTIWHEGLTRDAYGQWWEAQRRTAWGRRHLKRFALVRGEEVLASAKEYDLRAVVDGHPASVLGIGAVFTQPAHRGHGHARALVEWMLEEGLRRGVAFALLFSEIDPVYYARLGFASVATSESLLRVVEPPTGGAPATLVRAGTDRDLPDVAAMGQSRAQRFRFHLERDVDLIQFAIARKRLLAGLAPAGARQVQFFVAEEGASAAAYVVVSSRRGEWTVEEAGDRDPSGARAGAILQTLLARQPSEARPTITARLPAGFLPPQVVVAERRPAAEVMMVRPLATSLPQPLREEDILYWHSDVF